MFSDSDGSGESSMEVTESSVPHSEPAVRTAFKLS